MPLLGVEQGSEKTDPFQIQTIDSDRDDGPPHKDSRMCLSPGGHTEISQPQEDAGRHQQSHSLHLDGITSFSRTVAPTEEIGISQFLAVGPNQPQACRSTFAGGIWMSRVRFEFFLLEILAVRLRN